MSGALVKKDLHLPKGNIQKLVIRGKYFYHPIAITDNGPVMAKTAKITNNIFRISLPS